MLVIEQRKCFKLQTFVYVTVLLLMVTYIILGVASLVWFVMIQDDLEKEDEEDSNEDSLKIPIILLGIILVMCLLGSNKTYLFHHIPKVNKSNKTPLYQNKFTIRFF